MSIVLALSLICPSIAYADSFNANITDNGINVSGDIFGVEDMLPGDTFENDVTLTNNTKYTQKVYMFMDYKSSATEADKLFADVVDVDMISGDTVVHDGSISEIISEDKPIFVATLSPGDSETIDIDLVYPFEAAYEPHQNGLANIDWKLHSEIVDEAIDDNDTPGNNAYPNQGKDETGKSPQTGQGIFFSVLAGLGIILLIVGFVMFKRKKKEEE